MDAMLTAAKGYMSYEQVAARIDDDGEAEARYRKQIAEIESERQQ